MRAAIVIVAVVLAGLLARPARADVASNCQSAYSTLRADFLATQAIHQGWVDYLTAHPDGSDQNPNTVKYEVQSVEVQQAKVYEYDQRLMAIDLLASGDATYYDWLVWNMKDEREVHVDWLNWLVANPDDPRNDGSADWQRSQIALYDQRLSEASTMAATCP